MTWIYRSRLHPDELPDHDADTLARVREDDAECGRQIAAMRAELVDVRAKLAAPETRTPELETREARLASLLEVPHV
jgi:hypothetical protein